MQFYDFITQDEIDDLSEDHEAAFIEFVHIAQRRLRDFTRDYPDNDRDAWDVVNEARHSFVNIVVAAGKRYGIDPFATMEVPVLAKFGDASHKQFRADLDHYITQLVLGNAIQGKRDSVQVPVAVKERIRVHLAALRKAVDNADLNESKRSVLLDKLKAFEVELEKRRLSLLELTRITLAIAAIPGGIWASGDVVMKLVNNVIQAVAEAKAAEDEARQVASPEPMKALSPPRIDEVTSPPPEIFSADLDDEIPF
jgi:hypothetical protein